MIQGSSHDSRQAILIGSGIGGLSMGIILARLGYAVTILEKNQQPGGLMRSYIRDGVHCEVGVHYLGSLDNGQILRKYFDYLGVSDTIPVTRMGQQGIIDRYLFYPPGQTPWTFDLPPGLEAFREALLAAFPQAGPVIDRIMEGLRRAAWQLHSLDLLYAREQSFSMLDQFEPLGPLLDGLGCPSGLRSILAVPANWIGVPLHDCPAFYHHMALVSYLSSSYRLDCSGSAMAGAVADRFRALGGTIRTSAEVSAITTRSRVVTGVRLASGEELSGGLVVAAMHPKKVLSLLEKDAVKPSYRQRITGLRDTHGICAVHCRLDGRRHPDMPWNLFKVATDGRGLIADLKYYQIRATRKKDTSLLSILTSGDGERWRPWDSTATGRRGQAYLDAKEELAGLLIREAEAVLGRFSGLKILDVSTPLTLRDWVGSPDGSAYGVERSASQMLATAILNRTAVQGLYLTGQNVMAPGIIGAITGSFHTAKLILGVDAFQRQVVL